MKKHIAIITTLIATSTQYAREINSFSPETNEPKTETRLFGTPLKEIPLSWRLKPAALAFTAGVLVSQGARTIFIANPAVAYTCAAISIYMLIYPQNSKRVLEHTGKHALHGAQYFAKNAPGYVHYATVRAHELKNAIEQKHLLLKTADQKEN